MGWLLARLRILTTDSKEEDLANYKQSGDSSSLGAVRPGSHQLAGVQLREDIGANDASEGVGGRDRARDA